MFKKLIFKLIGSIISSLMIMFFLAILSLSIITKKFPPDMKLAKEYSNYLINAKSNYDKLVNQSQNQLNHQGITTDDLEVPTQNHPAKKETDELKKISEQDPEDSNSNNGPSKSFMKIYRPDDDQMKKEIKLLKARLDALELQNKLLLEKLNK